MIKDLIDVFKEWLPVLFVLIFMALMFKGVKHLISKRFAEAFSRYQYLKHGIFLTIFCVGVLLIVLALPVPPAVRGQLIGLLGLLASAVFALASATFVGNAMAGLMLRSVRSFQPGDFIEVMGHLGRISEFGFLHTEIQTEERNLTTLPNLYLVTNPVTVYRHSGTVVSAQVSLGYDIPRLKIETALKKAALKSELSDPFVHVLNLGDFSVTYRISGLLNEVKQLISARSRLRCFMLDCISTLPIIEAY